MEQRQKIVKSHNHGHATLTKTKRSLSCLLVTPLRSHRQHSVGGNFAVLNRTGDVITDGVDLGGEVLYELAGNNVPEDFHQSLVN